MLARKLPLGRARLLHGGLVHRSLQAAHAMQPALKVGGLVVHLLLRDRIGEDQEAAGFDRLDHHLCHLGRLLDRSGKIAGECRIRRPAHGRTHAQRCEQR